MQTLAPAWTLGNAATAKWYVRLLPSLNDLAFLLPILLLFARFDGTRLLFADGDTGWHLRTGEWIAAHHTVPTVDLFSFTKAGQPWFAWEWGWDLIFALIYKHSGLAGVGFVSSVILGLFGLLLYRVSLRLSGNHLTSIAATALAAGASSIHWLARPHLVSWLFTLLFLDVLLSLQRGLSAPILLLPVLMTFWTNMHGGFVAGILVVGCFAAGEFLSSLAAHGCWRLALGVAKPYWNCLALCLAATLINPYGWQLHRHIYAYLSDTELLDKIQEFQSISFHAGPALLLEIVLLLSCFAIFSKLRRFDFTPVLLICLWAHYALYSARHIPLLMIVAAPYIAEFLAVALAVMRRDMRQGGQSLPAVCAVTQVLEEMADDLRVMEAKPRLYAASAAGLVMLGVLFAAGSPPFAPCFNPANFPVSAMAVLERHSHSRIFTSDQWADYLIYRLYPAQRSFFDGRSDFYGNKFIEVNQRIASAAHDWKRLLARYSIDLVVLKPDVPLVAVLKETSGSMVLFDDGKVIVFDVGAIYKPVLGRSEKAARLASPVSKSQNALSGIALTLNRSTQSRKGKLS